MVLEVVAQRLATALADQLVRAVASIPTVMGKSTPAQPDLDRLARHLVVAANWSQRDDAFGFLDGRDTDQNSIPLRFEQLARRYKRNGRTSQGEDQLLTSAAHVMVVGAPGAGKTTTLKRVCRRLLSPPTVEEDDWSYPVVLRLREESVWKRGVHETLMEVLGIPPLSFSVSDRPTVDREAQAGETHEQAMDRVQKEETALADWIVAEDAERSGRREALYRTLDDSAAVVLADGLDEISDSAASARVENELGVLAESLSTAKVIATCRTGSYAAPIRGFDRYDLCPLNKTEAKRIVAKTFPKRLATEFWSEVQAKQLLELTDRPLLLIQLAILFEAEHHRLPSRPSEACEAIVDLLLREWDKRNRVDRETAYKDFSPRKKLDFLAHVAHALALRKRSLEFERQDLLVVYRQIHSRFALPADDAVGVVSEIESHTGIVVAAGRGYAFSHTSLQEFLSAHFLVRAWSERAIASYLATYPEVVAVALALSPEPGVLIPGLDELVRDSDRAVRPLLNRLCIERPHFDGSVATGNALIRLLAACSESQELDACMNVLEVPGVRDAVLVSLATCERELVGDTVELRSARRAEGLDRVRLPRALVAAVEE